MKFSLLLALALLAGPSADATPPGPTAISQQVTPPATPELTRVAAPAASEVEILRAQLVVMKEYNESILETVYWSIGAIFTFAVLLIGLNWFGAKRIHDNDIRSIRDNLQARFAEFKGELELSIRGTADEVKQNVQTAVDKAVKASNKELAAEVLSLRKQVRETAAQQKLHEARTDARFWKIQKVPANELLALVEIIRAARALKYDWEIDDSLDQICAILKVMRDRIDGASITEMIQLFDTLDAKHKANIDKVLAALK